MNVLSFTAGSLTLVALATIALLRSFDSAVMVAVASGLH